MEGSNILNSRGVPIPYTGTDAEFIKQIRVMDRIDQSTLNTVS